VLVTCFFWEHAGSFFISEGCFGST
jgi:hypothetical protein